jgi:hypothetical protein
MKTKCLMIETSEKKRYFTNLSYVKHFREYCLAFKSKMFIVKADISKNKIISMSKLVVALCDVNHKPEKVKFEVVERKNLKK